MAEDQSETVRNSANHPATRSGPGARHTVVTRIPLLVCHAGVCLAGLLAAAEPGQQALLKAVENRYNRAKTLEVQFHETYSGQGRPRQEESGQLILRKPGRMRW